MKSRGSSEVCGRVIEGRILELYLELTDSLTKALEEACVLSAIFALRYLSRDLAANVEQIDVRFSCDFTRSYTDGPSSISIGNLETNVTPSEPSGEILTISSVVSHTGFTQRLICHRTGSRPQEARGYSEAHKSQDEHTRQRDPGYGVPSDFERPV